jgi:hypothetical protein
LRTPADQFSLLGELVRKLTVRVRAVHYEPAASMASSEGDDYYSEFVVEARAQVASMLDGLHAGFERLEVYGRVGHAHRVLFQDPF